MKIKVENFQSISKAEIEVKGLTVITGQNNTGKSALARSIIGAFTNLRGNAFVRQGTQVAKVDILFDDGNHLIWSKGKNTNQYEINGKLIQKVGSDTPDEVLNLGVKAVNVDNKEIHPQFAKQFQQVFLIDLPPSSLASALSDVDVIQKLEQATASLRTDIKNQNSLNNAKRDELSKEKTKLEQFDGLDVLEEQAKRIEFLETQIDGLNAKLSVLQEIKIKKDKLEKLILVLNDLLHIFFTKGSEEVLVLDDKIQTANTIKAKRTILENLLNLKDDLDGISFFDLDVDLIQMANQLKDMIKISKVKNVLTKILDLEDDLVNTGLTNISIEQVLDRLSMLESNQRQRKILKEMLNYQSDLNSIFFSDFDLNLVDHLENLVSLRKQRTKVKLMTSILEIGLKNVHISDLPVLDDSLFEIKKQKDMLFKEIRNLNEDLISVSQELESLNEQIGDTCPLCQSGLHDHLA
jgi:DNA repair ATPase RecN